MRVGRFKSAIAVCVPKYEGCRHIVSQLPSGCFTKSSLARPNRALAMGLHKQNNSSKLERTQIQINLIVQKRISCTNE